MGSAPYEEPVRRPTGWLFLAFFGVWLYLIAALLQIYEVQVTNLFNARMADVDNLLGVVSLLGQILLFAGLVAALWRSNLAAGLTKAGVTGLTLGAAGVGILGLFELALVLNFLSIEIAPVSNLLGARFMGSVIANFLGFAGLASLAVGLTQATGLWRRLEIPKPRLAPPPAPAAAAPAPVPAAETQPPVVETPPAAPPAEEGPG